MVYEFKLPDVGDDDEADLLKWMVQEGDGVREDDPVAEVETERAIIEIPSPVDGKVLELCVDERERVGVGTTLAKFDTDEDGDDGREEGGVEILDNDGNTAVDVDAEGGAEYGSESSDEDVGVVSKSTELLAREVGVDIDDVEGSGADGRVVAQDVLRAAKEKQDEREEENGRRDEGEPPKPTEDAGRETEHDFGGDETPTVEHETAEETTMFGTEEDETVEEETVAGEAGVDTTGVEKKETVTDEERKADETSVEESPRDEKGKQRETAETRKEQRKSSSEETSVPVTHHEKADAERLTELSEEFGGGFADDVGAEDVRNALLVKACGVALVESQAFDDGSKLNEERRATNAKLRVATPKDEGTCFTVVENVDRKGVAEIASEIEGEQTDVPENESECVLTLYTSGTVGGEGTTPVAEDGDEAGLAVGEVRRRPSVVDEEVVAAYTVPMSVSFDPASVDGTDCARFLEYLRSYVEEPARMLL